MAAKPPCACPCHDPNVEAVCCMLCPCKPWKPYQEKKAGPTLLDALMARNRRVEYLASKERRPSRARRGNLKP